LHKYFTMDCIPFRMHTIDKSSDNFVLDPLSALLVIFLVSKFWLQHQIFYHLNQTEFQQTSQNGCIENRNNEAMTKKELQ